MTESGVDVSIERKDEARAEGGGRRDPNTCPSCGSHYREDELRAALRICPQCRYHFPMPAWERIDSLADRDTFEEESAGGLGVGPGEFLGQLPYYEQFPLVIREEGLAHTSPPVNSTEVRPDISSSTVSNSRPSRTDMMAMP